MVAQVLAAASSDGRDINVLIRTLQKCSFCSSLAFEAADRFNERGEDNHFVLGVGAFCLTPRVSPSVICPLVRRCVIEK